MQGIKFFVKKGQCKWIEVEKPQKDSTLLLEHIVRYRCWINSLLLWSVLLGCNLDSADCFTLFLIHPI